MPVWSRDQKHLYYWTMEGTVVTIMGCRSSRDQHSPGVRATPASAGRSSSDADTQYDVWNDRFLVLKAARTGEVPPAIVIVENWFEELTKRVPRR